MKPVWWKNSLSIIKSLTTDDSYATFTDLSGVAVEFAYYVYIDGQSVRFDDYVTKDALSASNLLGQIENSLKESFRLQIERHVAECDRNHIVGY